MNNRDIFQKDPLSSSLRNDGVAAISMGDTEKEIATLRHELETFVCEGQYEQGMVRILEAFLKGTESSSQQAAWVSGFYGSGKSHLLKMLQHLWTDIPFASDGATPRGLTHLPDSVHELLQELAVKARQAGGLHAVAGTMPSGGSKSVRLSVLGFILQSKGLPGSWPQARFVLWLRSNGLEQKVRAAVVAAGKEFDKEIGALYTSPALTQAILDADPDFAADAKKARETLRAQFPPVDDLSTPDLIKAIREVLAGPDKQIPLTVIVLDEVQLYIGQSDERSVGVQEVAESLCKQLDSRILLIGAGQTALAAGIPQLQKLQARFTARVELSDQDVETVTRRVVLAKKPTAAASVSAVLEKHAGEISRQLSGTGIGQNSADKSIAVEDYPVLPVRRRFWEAVMRAIDVAGVQAQLRSQLRIVHEAVREIADKPLGWVVPADFFFFQQAPSLLQTASLLKTHHETIMKLGSDGTADGRLKQRICALIWLIRKLPREAAADIKVRATEDTIADLLISDLSDEGASLRKEVPRLLEALTKDSTLIKVEGGEYSLQTRESSDWDALFRQREGQLRNNLTTLTQKRADLIKAACQASLAPLRVPHPNSLSKETRELSLHFGAAPPDAATEIPVWIRDGWGDSDAAVLADARKAGTDSATIFAWLRKDSSSELENAIIQAEAATSVIEAKGPPASDEAREALESMRSRQRDAGQRRDEIIREVITSANVWTGGGTEQHGLEFRDKALASLDSALARRYPKFSQGDADLTKWRAVQDRARKGDAAALDVLGYKGDPERHPVCQALMAKVGTGARGRDLRRALSDPPFGWPQDAVDACLILLVVTNHLRASQSGSPLAATQLDQSKLGTLDFSTESQPLSAPEKIKLRKLFSRFQKVNPGEEPAAASAFLARLSDLAGKAGGPPPLPANPDTDLLDSIRGKSGNDQLKAILDEESALAAAAEQWDAAASAIEERRPRWELLSRLLRHAEGLPGHAEFKTQALAIHDGRQLLVSPDPVPPLIKTVAGEFRAALTGAHSALCGAFNAGTDGLTSDPVWQKLTPAQQADLRNAHQLHEPAPLKIGDDAALLATLDHTRLDAWQTRLAAIPAQVTAARLAAAKLLEPKAQSVSVRKATLKSEADLNAWLNETEKEIIQRLKEGPVVIS